MNLRRLAAVPAALLLGSVVVACAPPYDPTVARTESSTEAGSATQPAATDAGIDAVRAALAEYLPGLPNQNIHPSAAPGLYELRHGAQFAYVTADGRYLIEGDLVDLTTGISLTENKRKDDRRVKLAELGDENMIVFAPAKPSDASHTVTVFTDIDCGYCRKLHREIEEYTDRGITVRYAFYPRSGPNSESFRKAEAVWCSDDRKAALTQAKQGAPVTGKPDCPNPVQREFDLGSELGLRGTPMIVLPDGEVVNGYVPAARLAERLDAPPEARKG